MPGSHDDPAATAAREPAAKLRAAMLSPMPPQPSGIADYTAELVPALAPRFESLDIVVADDAPEYQGPPLPCRILRATAFDRLDAFDPYDVVFYQHGNNPMHRYLYERCRGRPGVAVLHDAVLHHLVAGTTLADGKPWAYAAELRYAEGLAGERIAQIRARGLFAEWHTFLFPAITRAVEHAKGVIVHGARAERTVHDRCPGIHVRRVRHHFAQPPGPIGALSAREARARVGLPAEAFVVASLGFVTPPKRIDVALEAFARASAGRNDWLYCIVGDAKGLDRGLVDRLGLTGRVHVAGSVPLETFQIYVAAADAIVALRYPSAGESSGSLVRALGAGKAAIVSNGPTAWDYPPEVLVRVPVIDGEVEAVEAALRRLHDEPAWREQIGRTAKAFVRVRCTVEESARAYAEVAHRVAAARCAPPKGVARHAWVDRALAGWADDSDHRMLSDPQARRAVLDAFRHALAAPPGRWLVAGNPAALAFVLADDPEREVSWGTAGPSDKERRIRRAHALTRSERELTCVEVSRSVRPARPLYDVVVAIQGPGAGDADLAEAALALLAAGPRILGSGGSPDGWRWVVATGALRSVRNAPTP